MLIERKTPPRVLLLGMFRFEQAGRRGERKRKKEEIDNLRTETVACLKGN